MGIVDKLKAEHVEIRRVAGDLAAMLESESPTDPAALAACRWSVVRLVTRHLALEDQHIYGPLQRAPGSAGAATAQRLKRDLGSLYAAFQMHITTWTGEAVVRDWDGYRAAARQLLAALDSRIDREEAELYPLIGAADLRDAA